VGERSFHEGFEARIFLRGTQCMQALCGTVCACALEIWLSPVYVCRSADWDCLEDKILLLPFLLRSWLCVEWVCGVSPPEQQGPYPRIQLCVSPVLTEQVQRVDFSGDVVKLDHARCNGFSHTVVRKGEVTTSLL
jgi:hypothetical protein